MFSNGAGEAVGGDLAQRHVLGAEVRGHVGPEPQVERPEGPRTILSSVGFLTKDPYAIWGAAGACKRA